MASLGSLLDEAEEGEVYSLRDISQRRVEDLLLR